MTIQYNVNLIGSLSNTNGVLSGFSANSNYATFSGDTFNDTDVEIVFKTKFNRVTGDEQMCYAFYDSTKTYSLCVMGLSGGKFYFEITNGSISLGDISGTTTVAINTDYYIKAVRNNTTYTLYSSTNGTNWTTEGTLSNITFPSYTSATNYIGGYVYDDNGLAIDQILDGTIDLNESYIKVGGQYVWRGVTNITTIQLRRDTAANWTTANPVLAEGEVGIETDTRKQKFGDGSTAWNSLSYSNGDMKQNVLTAGSNIQINGDTISATNTTYSAMSVSEGTTGTATTARTMRADRLKSIIQGTKLTGLSMADNSAVVATDDILTGIGKLQTRTESAYNKAVSKADWFEIESPLTSTYDNSGIVLGTDCYITSDGVLTGGTAWNDGIMDTVSSVNLINDYWEWNGYFKYTSISAEEELIAVDGVNDNGFLFHIKPNGDVINPDDNNKVLANVGANDWVEFNIVHQAGDTDITVTLDTTNGKVTTTTALATTTAQALHNTCWHCNDSYGIEFLVRNDESWWKTSAGGTFYPFVTRYIGVDNTAFDGQWTNNTATNIVNGSNITWTSGHNYDLSEYLPNDGHVYEVIFTASWNGSTAGSNHELRASTDIITSPWNWLGRISGQNAAGGTCILPVGSGRYVKLTTAAKACNSVYFSALGYRRLGTNS